MKRMTIVCASLVSALAVAGPAAADSDNANNVAAKQCAAEKKTDKAAFNALYGPKHAMRNCVKGTEDEATDALKNASKECKAERQADPVAFDATYASHGKCVSQKVKAHSEDEVEAFKNAAKECKAEREADPDAFRATYGTNENGRNALGQCVSQKDDETP